MGRGKRRRLMGLSLMVVVVVVGECYDSSTMKAQCLRDWILDLSQSYGDVSGKEEDGEGGRGSL